MKPILFTKSGSEALQKEQQELRQKRVGAVAELKRARELGDLSENGAYKVARSKLSGIDRRILQISLILRRAQIVEKPMNGIVGIGSRVTIMQNGEQAEYEIVGGYESDPLKGKISHFSPLGKALLGKKVDNEIEFFSPSGMKKLVIKFIK